MGGVPAPPPTFAPHAPTRGWNERVTLLLGKRSLNDDTVWEPLDAPAAVGLELESLGLGVIDLGIGIHLARENKALLGSDFHTETFEFDIGGRRTWEVGSLRPYLGAGLAFVSTHLHIDHGAYDEMDHAVGYYAQGGAYVLLGEEFSLGVDYRVVAGTDIDLPGFISTDVDYDQVSISLGFMF